MTDFIREVNYQREGRGSYYFEPAHLQYIPLRKEVLDIIQVRGGRGVTTVTFHFKQV